MRDDDKFEIVRAFDLLPHVAGSSWATVWFRLNQQKKPSREEFRGKVVEYFELLDHLFESYPSKEEFEPIIKYIQRRREEEIQKIREGLNKEVEKRYDRYIDYG